MSNIGKTKGICSTCQKTVYESSPDVLFMICKDHYLINCCDIQSVPLIDMCEKCTSKCHNISNHKVRLCTSIMPLDD